MSYRSLFITFSAALSCCSSFSELDPAAAQRSAPASPQPVAETLPTSQPDEQGAGRVNGSARPVPTGGLDQANLPFIIDASIETTAPIFARCGEVTICVTARDPQDGPDLRYVWQQTEGPELFSGPFSSQIRTNFDEGATSSRDASKTECAQFQPTLPGLHTFELSLFQRYTTPEGGEPTDAWLIEQAEAGDLPRTVEQIVVNITGKLAEGTPSNPELFEVIQDDAKLGMVRPLNLGGGGSSSNFYNYQGPFGDPICIQDELAEARPGPALFSYNGHLCHENAPLPQSDHATLALYRAPREEATARLALIIDDPHDGTGGTASLTITGIGEDPDSGGSFFDDPGEQPAYDSATDTATFNWSWTEIDSDGMAMRSLSWQQCLELTADFQSGITGWSFHTIDEQTPPITLDTTQPVSLCPAQCSAYVDLPGDANRDGSVNGADFLIWQRNNGETSGATWAQGDFDGDQDVDQYDRALLQQYYGRSR